MSVAVLIAFRLFGTEKSSGVTSETHPPGSWEPSPPRSPADGAPSSTVAPPR
jgi:hypothetical protein